MSDRSQGILLRDVLPEAEFLGRKNVRITSCCADSRHVQSGDLFVALPGTQHDGHDYIREAVQRAAQAVVSQQGIALADVPVCVVPDTRVAFGHICQALRGNPAERLKLIGITGTNGKTTTSFLVSAVLEAAGLNCGVLGTLGYRDGYIVEPTSHTTPSAPSLAESLSRFETAGCSHVAMEVSSHALAQSRVAGLHFDTVCVTNVQRDHLDYHRDQAEYRRAKARIFDYTLPESVVVLNADDPGSASYLPILDGPALTVGIEAPAELKGMPLECHLSEQTFMLTAGEDNLPVRTHPIGTHNIYNCLMAACVGVAYGIDLPTIVRGLEAVKSVPGRLERIECGQPFGVFVDYAHTPDALANVLMSLRPLVHRRLICVFGAGGDRDRQKRPLMGREVNQLADLAIVTSDNPRSEDPQGIIADILHGMPHRDRLQVVPDRGEAITAALAAAEPGDCVLLAGKGHENYQLIGEQRLHFDDAQFARNWLYQRSDIGGGNWARSA